MIQDNTTDIIKYRKQKSQAKARGIDWQLTFDEWFDIWQKSGFYHLRGKGKGSYVMSRYNDTGPYHINNIFIQSNSKNIIDAQKGRLVCESTKIKQSTSMMGKNKGNIAWNKNKLWPEEIKMKMRKPKTRK